MMNFIRSNMPQQLVLIVLVHKLNGSMPPPRAWHFQHKSQTSAQ